MLLLSMGLTCGTFCSNEAMLTSGRIMTVPEICAGSRLPITPSRAMIDAYSVPWAPETSANVGPGLLPRMTTTGIWVAASEPARTSSVPVAFWPDSAVAVPTVNGDCGWAAAEIGKAQDSVAIAAQSKRGMKPPGRQNNPAGMARQESAQVSVGDLPQEAL